MTTMALNHLWAYLESLGLNNSYRRWLAEKLIEPTKTEEKYSEDSDSLRAAFSGDWGKDMDSADYAQLLRDESVINNRETELW